MMKGAQDAYYEPQVRFFKKNQFNLEVTISITCTIHPLAVCL